MNKIKFKSIPIMEWGNNLTISGILFENKNGNDKLLMLPQKKSESNDYIEVTTEEWIELNHQLDYNLIEGTLEDGQKVILKKGQRVIDQKISWDVFRRDKYKCRYCGIDHVPLTIDHLITWESGGPTIKENLFTSCRKCNKTRGNLSLEVWFETDYYKSVSSKYLTEKERQKNLNVLSTLINIKLVKVIKNR